MKKLPLCRICLVENVRKYVVADKNLQEIYEKLTDIPLVTEDDRPMLACYFCYAKLKQSYRLQRKCLEAEKIFSQILKEEYETKLLLNQDELKINGYIVSPIVHVSIYDECETDNIKQETITDFEGQDNENQTELKHEFEEIEIVNIQPHHSESKDINPLRSESEDEIPLKNFKIEVGEELEENKPTHLFESDADDTPLINFRTKVGEEQEVNKKKRKANKTKRALSANKQKRDRRGAKSEETITTQRKNNEQPNSKIIRQSHICTSTPIESIDPFTGSCSSNGLKKRKRMKRYETPVECDTCQRSFRAKNDLIKHIRIHTGETPYVCKICKRGFKENGNLTKHMRVHSDEKPYKCDLCPRSFKRQHDLRSHIRVHTGEKPFKCKICLRSFSEQGSMLKHTSIHTDGKTLKCNMCQHSFRGYRNLKRHIRVHTSKNPFKCEICEKSFTKKPSLKRHIVLHKDEDKDKDKDDLFVKTCVYVQ